MGKSLYRVMLNAMLKFVEVLHYIWAKPKTDPMDQVYSSRDPSLFYACHWYAFPLNSLGRILAVLILCRVSSNSVLFQSICMAFTKFCFLLLVARTIYVLNLVPPVTALRVYNEIRMTAQSSVNVHSSYEYLV